MQRITPPYGSIIRPRGRKIYTHPKNCDLVPLYVTERAARASGQRMTAPFSIEGQDFIALNGGPMLSSPRLSFVVNCETRLKLIITDNLLQEKPSQAR